MAYGLDFSRLSEMKGLLEGGLFCVYEIDGGNLNEIKNI